jgi:hypothetical protein
MAWRHDRDFPTTRPFLVRWPDPAGGIYAVLRKLSGNGGGSLVVDYTGAILSTVEAAGIAAWADMPPDIDPGHDALIEISVRDAALGRRLWALIGALMLREKIAATIVVSGGGEP